MVEQGVDEGAPGIACGGMNHHAGGFVEDEEIGVFKEDFQGNIFGGGAGEGDGFRFVDADLLARPEFFARLDGAAFNEDVPLLDEGLEPGTGKVGVVDGEKVVQALAGGFGRGTIFRHLQVWVAHGKIISQNSFAQSLFVPFTLPPTP